jgi:hypothetical protein
VTFWEVTSLHVNALRQSIATRSRTTTTTTTDTMRRTMRNMWLETSPSVRKVCASSRILPSTSSAAWKRMLVVTAVPRRISWTRLQHLARLEHLQDRVGHAPRTWPSRKTPEIAEGVQVIPDGRSSTCSAVDHWKLQYLHQHGHWSFRPSWSPGAKED